MLGKILARSIAVATALSLAACGGGGGGGSAQPADNPPGGSGGPQLPPRALSALQSEVPALAYPETFEGGLRKATVERLNAARAAQGIGLLRQDARLDEAAQGHADYLVRNNFDTDATGISHFQVPGRPGFTGVTMTDRARAAGYPGASAENIAGINQVRPGQRWADRVGQCAEGLLGVPYHAASVASGARDIGVGVAPIGRMPGDHVCVLMVGVGSGQGTQLPLQTSLPVVYPLPDDSNVSTTFYGETPDPIPDLSKPRGRFVWANLASYETQGVNAVEYTIARFVLKDSNGNLVPARLIAHRNHKAGPGVELTVDPNPGYLPDGFVALLPLSVLLPGHAYQAEFAATARGLVFERNWSFTTRADD